MQHNFALSTESGQIFGYDARNMSKPLFEKHAHESACSQVQFSPHIPNMMVTSGTDGYVKVWDISQGQPMEVASRDVKQGELFTLQFCQDIPWVVAAGGSKGELAVWDMSESKKIESHFKSNIIGDSYKKTDYDPAEPGNDEMDDAGAEKETDDYEDLPDSDDEEMEE